MAAPDRKTCRRWASVLALHLLLAAVWTWPAISEFDTSLFGSGVRGDKYQFIWDFWWMKHALFTLHQSPFTTSMQFHPTGTSLALHDLTPFWSLLSIPLQSLTSPAVAFNLLLLACFPLNGAAAYHLAYQIGRRHWPALAASVLFACCPYLVKCFRDSHISLLGVFFLPLFALELWRYAETRRASALARAGVYLGLTTLMHYYYAVFLGLVTAAWLVYQLGRLAPLPTRGADLRSLGRGVASMAVAALLISGPAIGPGIIELARGDFSPGGPKVAAGYQRIELRSADLATFVLPDVEKAKARLWSLSEGTEALASAVRGSLSNSTNARSVYPGVACWLALACVLVSRSLRGRYWSWAALGGAGLVLALGPTLTVMGEQALRGMLPGRLLTMLPVVDFVAGVFRYTILLSLGGAVCLAVTLVEWGRRRGAGQERVMAIAAIILTLVEFVPHATPSFPNDAFLSQFYERVRDEPGDFAILNVPVDFAGSMGGGDIYLYAQTVHQKKMVGGYVSHSPRYAGDPIRKFPFLRALKHRRYRADKALALSPEALENLEATLDSLGVRYVVLHRIELPGAEWARVNSWLEPRLGRPVWEDRWIRAYAYTGGSSPVDGSVVEP